MMRTSILTLMGITVFLQGSFAQSLTYRLLEQRKLLLEQLAPIGQERIERYYTLTGASHEIGDHISANAGRFQQLVIAEHADARKKITQLRVEGTLQDLSLLGSTGDLATGGVVAGLNMLTRKAILDKQSKTNARKAKELREEAEREERISNARLEEEFNRQVEKLLHPITKGMNILFAQRPSQPRLPGKEAPDTTRSVYFYFGVPLIDRVLISEVWRLDRYRDGDWWPITIGMEEFLEQSGSYKSLLDQLEFSKALKERNPRQFTEHFMIGSFPDFVSAAEHQTGLLNKARQASIPVELAVSVPQATTSELDRFVEEGTPYWGKVR